GERAGAVVAQAVVRRQQTRQQGGMGRQGKRHRGRSLLEADPFGSDLVEPRRDRRAVAVAAQVVRPDSVHGHQDEVRIAQLLPAATGGKRCHGQRERQERRSPSVRDEEFRSAIVQSKNLLGGCSSRSIAEPEKNWEKYKFLDRAPFFERRCGRIRRHRGGGFRMSDGYDEARANRNFLERLGEKIPGYRGFQDRELRRDVDRLLRERLATELGRLKALLRDRARAFTDAGKIAALNGFDRADRQLDGLSQSIRFSDYG